jgi:hypothetical protein
LFRYVAFFTTAIAGTPASTQETPTTEATLATIETAATAVTGINIFDLINNMNASKSRDPSDQHQQEHMQQEERQQQQRQWLYHGSQLQKRRQQIWTPATARMPAQNRRLQCKNRAATPSSIIDADNSMYSSNRWTQARARTLARAGYGHQEQQGHVP